MDVYEGRKVTARVISQKGKCEAGHKVGDEFVLSDMCPQHMCAWAFYALFPYAQVLMCGGTFPWEKEPDNCTVACSDPINPVVFELTKAK